MKIDKGIPLPNSVTDRIMVGPLPLKEMKVGDSIRVDAANGQEFKRKITSLRVRVRRFSNKYPQYKFSVIKCNSRTSGNYIRIFRVSRRAGI